jgi:hypothetical protein
VAKEAHAAAVEAASEVLCNARDEAVKKVKAGVEKVKAFDAEKAVEGAVERIKDALKEMLAEFCQEVSEHV